MSLLKNKKGFTIIELLIVMGIIAVLIALSVAGLTIAQRQARTTSRLTDADTIRTAIEEYKQSNSGAYPASNTSFTVSGLSVTIGGRIIPVQASGLTFAATTATCAATQSAWSILYANNGNTFDLYVCTESGKSQNLGGY